jgi:hypothetical protein
MLALAAFDLTVISSPGVRTPNVAVCPNSIVMHSAQTSTARRARTSINRAGIWLALELGSDRGERLAFVLLLVVPHTECFAIARSLASIK